MPVSEAAATTTSQGRAGIGLRQWIKLVVYTLLLANFAFYIYDDWQIAQHTLDGNSGLLDWSSAFAASIDELAWFVPLFLFELETYALPDASFTHSRVLLMHSVRLVCYLFLAHTLFAYASAALDLEAAIRAEHLGSPCELLGQDISYGYNLEYTELDAGNCAGLSDGEDLYLVEEGLVVVDENGLLVARQLAWLDLAEASTWLLILLIIEVMVRLQERGVTRGGVMRSLQGGKVALYGLLWLAAVYWIYRGHYVYAWDEALWILGFMAIDMNLSQWRDEIEEEEAGTRQSA